ncbi:MAG TPA: SidA/IucD/PvdA family monooxygenase [Candidatus Limnocylindrales bacterium]|nr:SidA/IucD/PvdA family monooxygenase [Candidatus Limnocylindrales bacterium]
MGRTSAIFERHAGTTPNAPFDIVGVGFGPSNLALAVCAREQDDDLACVFVERNLTFRWHPGMLIDGARMQISFLKDLVSLRNPASPYTFLQYTKAHGRLEHFVNLNEFRPTRVEYDDYLRWVARDFDDVVRYGTDVTSVRPATHDGAALFEVHTEEVVTGARSVMFARNVVYAAGGKPKIPSGCELSAPSMIHSSQFLHYYPHSFPQREQPYSFVVAGAGQSGGEITDYLLSMYPAAQVHLVISGYGPRPTDNSPFVNEQFQSGESARFYMFDERKREALRGELLSANYGVIREDLLDRLYNQAYLDAVRGTRRLFMHACTRLSAVRPDSHRPLVAVLADRFDASEQTVRCDGVVLATGYRRTLDECLFGDLLPSIRLDAKGHPVITRDHRVEMASGAPSGLYVQGYAESRFGLGDTLLSLLPFRSKEIIDSVRASRPARRPARAARAAAYPPPQYLEHDTEKLLALIERFKFATIISAVSPDHPVATQLPMVLDRSRGPFGGLFGHMDRANPHAQLIDGREMLIVFSGPNSYISPDIYETDQLPTWNSMAVHVRGRARPVVDRGPLVRGLCRIAQMSEMHPRLTADDPRIDHLIGHIVGFEVEITDLVGRFKLSQDRSGADRHRAALALARHSEAGEREFIEYVTGMSLACEAEPRLLTSELA